MRVELPAGKYLVAVSGGVDSVVLLDLLAKQAGLALAVAHFDHGIRKDSVEDRKFVEKLAKKYGREFITSEGRLGARASEAVAREARYEFLESARLEFGASAIVTAHHQDDLIETAIINLLRGTNRRGLSSLKSTDTIRRPLLGYPKAEIKKYALANQLTWREDPTNADTKYLRNYVRLEIVPKLSASDRQKLLAIIASASHQNAEIDNILGKLVGSSAELDRAWLGQLAEPVRLEVLASWLRANGVNGYDRKALVRLSKAAQTARNGTRHNVMGDKFMLVTRDKLALVANER